MAHPLFRSTFFMLGLAASSAFAQVVNITNIKPLCTGSTLNLAPYGTPAGGLWSGPLVSGSTLNAGFVPGNYTVTYTVNLIAVSRNVRVIAAPTVSPSGTFLLCPDEMIQFSATPAGGSWTPPAGPDGLVLADGFGDSPVTYNYTDPSGSTCNSGTQAMVEMRLRANAEFLNAPFNVCIQNGTIQISGLAEIAGGAVLFGPGVSNSVKSGNLVTADFDPVAAGPGTHEIRLQVLAPGMCSNDISTLITVQDCWHLVMALQTDDYGSETTWEIVNQATGFITCSGSGYASNSAFFVNCYVPSGCYDLRVYDTFGDGMTYGTYGLATAGGDRIIDANGYFGSFSQAQEEFCLVDPPNTQLGPTNLKAAWCDRFDLVRTNKIACKPAAGATGYEFWLFDPHGTYSRKVLRSTNALKLSSINSNPPPAYVDLNVRVRAQLGGHYTNFGSACIIRINDPLFRSAEATEPIVEAGTGMQLFPNPTLGAEVFITIDALPEETQAADVQLMDALGRTVHTARLPVSNGSLRSALRLPDHLLPGPYVVRVTVDDQVEIGRLLIQR